MLVDLILYNISVYCGVKTSNNLRMICKTASNVIPAKKHKVKILRLLEICCPWYAFTFNTYPAALDYNSDLYPYRLHIICLDSKNSAEKFVEHNKHARCRKNVVFLVGDRKPRFDNIVYYYSREIYLSIDDWNIVLKKYDSANS